LGKYLGVFFSFFRIFIFGALGTLLGQSYPKTLDIEKPKMAPASISGPMAQYTESWHTGRLVNT